MRGKSQSKNIDSFMKKTNNLIYTKMLKNLLLQNQPYDKNITHVSMGDIKGKYLFKRNTILNLFQICASYKGTEGVAEIPQHYSMLRFDFDKELKVNPNSGVPLPAGPVPLFKTNMFLNDIIPKIQKYLSENIIDFKPEHADCCLLTKEPYMKDEKTIKHGIHLQFINAFVSKEAFDQIEHEFKHLGIDMGMAKKPWLIYGQSKGVNKTYYKADCVLKYDGTVVEAEEYFKNYIVYDEDENPLFWMKDPTEIYPNIFSVIPFNRPTIELVIHQQTDRPAYRNERVEIDHSCPEISEIIQSYLDANPYYKEGSWNGNFLQLKRTKTSLCPTHGTREHDNRDAYIVADSRGFVKIGCYCNESKCVVIGKYKTQLEPSRSVGINCEGLNLKCDEAEFVYNSFTKGKTHMYNGKTYGEIALIDRSFAEWHITKRVFPHAVNFAKILGVEYDDRMDLEYLNPNEVINQNDIGSYIPRLEKADVVCMRSNMMTYKTQNLKELFSTYKRVLIVSFRVSLEDEYMKNFSEFGFKLYSDFKGVVQGNRIITQIDSLYKVRGEFDLLIMDEITYTMDHLVSFVKRKSEVWDALSQYISFTPKIIACDALLDKASIELFRQVERTIWVVENKWESFAQKKVMYYNFVDIESTIKHILEQLKEFGSLYIPTNSKQFAIKLFNFLKSKGVKVGMDSSDNEPTPSSEWKNFDVFITTPTNIAGVSCNDQFGKTIAYFTSASCSAEMSSQMLFRVRNTKADQYDIFIKQAIFDGNYPTSISKIKEWIKSRDELILNSGLKLNYIRNELKEDEYYQTFINYIKKINLSKKFFKSKLKGILNAHGLITVKSPQLENAPILVEDMGLADIPKIIEERKELNVIKEETKKLYEGVKFDEREHVCKAKTLTENEFKSIDEKHRKTKDEKAQIRKYWLQQTYGNDIKLTPEFVKKYEGKMTHYKNLQKMNTEHLELYITKMLDSHEKEIIDKDNSIERLHEHHSLLKIWCAHNIIKVLGFENIWDTKELQGYPYKAIIEFMKKYGKHISVLFNTKDNIQWDIVEVPEDGKGNKAIVTYINNKLKDVCNIRVSDKNRAKSKNAKQEYKIQGLEFWTDGGIKIPKNSIADSIWTDQIKDEENPKKRLLTFRKEQVAKRVWKCVSEVVTVVA